MVIDYNFITSRIEFLIEENNQNSKNRNDKPVKIPQCVKKFLYPLERWYYFFKRLKRAIHESKIKAQQVLIFHFHPLALIFMKYFFIENQKPYFDTSIYFEKNQDDELIEFIDNRIISTIGLNGKRLTKIQKEDIEAGKYIRKKVKKTNGSYTLTLNETEKYVLPISIFPVDVFLHHYGLKELSNAQRKQIENKDFLDIGAFCGDTCLVLSHYYPRGIYAYEPVQNNYNLLLKTIELNKSANIIPVKKGIGEEITSMPISIKADCSSLIFEQGTLPSEAKQTSPIKKEYIDITTIDEECKNKTVGLIKMDIEGFEYYAIKGGLKTIQRDKPILLISIYHTAKDFFEIPPMIRSVCPDYKFRYIDIYPSNFIADKIFMAFVD
jgi:FkbM family methyltransferase